MEVRRFRLNFVLPQRHEDTVDFSAIAYNLEKK